MAVNMLVSYAYTDIKNLGGFRKAMPCGRLMIDSGAFTADTLGKKISLDEYADFLQTWTGVWDHAVTLDVIGDPKATRANTHKLHRRGIPVLPVFTRGGTLADFDAMVKDSGYVCVGGGVGIPQNLTVARYAALQRRAQDLGGGIHALGMGHMDGLRKIRPYSADSSRVCGTFMWGTIATYDGRQIRLISKTDRKQLRKYHLPLRDAGLDVAELVRSGKIPTGVGRGPLMQVMSMAFVCADEDTSAFQVPVPSGIDDTPGTHLYSAVSTGGNLAIAVAELDTKLHDPDWSVPMWNRYRVKHQRQCRVADSVQVPA